MASSPLTPLTASSMLSAMGWEKFQMTPGIFSNWRFMAAISSSLFCWKTGRHCSFCLRSTKYSVLKKPVVSVPSSGLPTWLVATVTSGNEASSTRAWLAGSRAGIHHKQELVGHPEQECNRGERSGEGWSGERWSGEHWSGEHWSGEHWSGER